MLSVAAFAGLSAAFGAASYMCSKIMSVTVSNMMTDNATCTHCIQVVAVSVVCIVIFAVLQVHWLNEALRIQDCLTVVPAYYALAILIQSISAAIIFDELSSYGTKQSVAYVVGITILIFGVFRLSDRHVNNDSGKLAELSKSMVNDVPDEERIHLLRQTPDQLWRKVRIHTHALVAKDRLRNLRRLRAASAASISIGL
jgi:C4-dicarboxylate transporter